MNQATQQIQNQLQQIEQKIKDTQIMLKDPELANLAQEELKSLKDQQSALTHSLKTITGDFEKSSSPDDYNMDANNCILEIRGGAGGDEAKIFATDLIRMYERFAQIKNFKIKSLDEGVVKIKGKGAYGTFKYESGVHRVQRVPVTESQGRIHTSTASVAVLPEVKNTSVEIREEDLEWKFTRAGGKGGQNVNKVNTAVLLTHTPSGLVVNCRQERSQQQNRILALDLLRSRLWEIEEEQRLAKISSKRKAAVGRAMRAEKIRTYNYPENRVTDHRIKKTWHNLDRIVQGNLDQVIEAIKLSEPEEAGQ